MWFQDDGSTPLSTTVNVVIEVGDVQDMEPTFVNSMLSLSVFENTAAVRRLYNNALGTRPPSACVLTVRIRGHWQSH